MPKRLFTPVKLPEQQPDRCADCPLIGLIPKDERPAGSREGFVCLGTNEALSSKGIRVRASRRDDHHPLHRPCDGRWLAWMSLKGRLYNLSIAHYIRYRLPYEQGSQLNIIFH